MKKTAKRKTESHKAGNVSRPPMSGLASHMKSVKGIGAARVTVSHKKPKRKISA